MEDENWIKNNKPENWLLEEYKLLFQNYYHEDNSIDRQHAFYTTVNGVLLTLIGSSFVEKSKISLYFVPIIGILICVSWILSFNRVKTIRNNILERIYVIENKLHEIWGEGQDLMPLDTKNFEKVTVHKRRKIISHLNLILNGIPSSYSNMVLPISFSIIWIVLIIINLINI